MAMHLTFPPTLAAMFESSQNPAFVPLLPSALSKSRTQKPAVSRRRSCMLSRAAFLGRKAAPAMHVPSATCTCSVQTPDSFSTKWYQDTIAPLDMDMSSHHIPNSDAPSLHATDHNFVDKEAGVMALVDYASSSPRGTAVLEDIRETLSHNSALYGREARVDLRRALSSAILRHGAPPGFSALVMDGSSNVIRVAWTGSCGFILIRDNKIFYRSYADATPRDALESHLSRKTNENQEGARKHWLSWGGKATPSATGGYIASQLGTDVPQAEDFTIDCDEVYADYIELEDNDLVIAGSDGFFANLSEEQILAFVRPLPDGAEDQTLAIANATCLGSWRWDDVDFISYYLAIIADNFATASNSKPHLPFPFPPSPHLDDVTVMCAACSFCS